MESRRRFTMKPAALVPVPDDTLPTATLPCPVELPPIDAPFGKATKVTAIDPWDMVEDFLTTAGRTGLSGLGWLEAWPTLKASTRTVKSPRIPLACNKVALQRRQVWECRENLLAIFANLLNPFTKASQPTRLSSLPHSSCLQLRMTNADHHKPVSS